MLRKILSSVMAFSLMLTLPYGIVHAEDTLDVPQVVTEEQMNYELGPESPYAGQYITYGIDENGNYVRLSVTSIEARSATATIAIYIGKILVGYITSTVVDGIVIAATGQSGAEWAAAAIQSVLNKPYSSIVTIPKETVCMGYPMYGWKPEYCR